MAKIQKSLALTVLMSLIVFGAFTAANLIAQDQAQPIFTPAPTDHPTSIPTGTHHPTSEPTGTHSPTPTETSPTPTGTHASPTVSPTASPNQTIPTITVSPSPGGVGIGGVNWNMWGWIIGGLIALLAILLIAWAVYHSRHNSYRHPPQDIHGHTNPEEADRRTYTTTQQRQYTNPDKTYVNDTTSRTYSGDINRRDLHPEDTIDRRIKTGSNRVTDDIDRHLYSEDTDTS
ncbi:MAG: hypothetical protein LBH74_01860 [Nitrososphaerota archaeon]|jgi:hypothetical protein|uniref:hypothetical protein n=1 Tax=Candidatus Bathycorpusculum sp. TaxID=2994959 RepID=UPI00281E8E1D|nr:hypothetical protein [Candidatus Termitimicrobium sp.]MCL2432717.1 hypothetical protein [Candidatus Termitimicrobium sp.]MDR0492374.1 hypothetical protein [Nitrososphaerota archaeon]